MKGALRDRDITRTLNGILGYYRKEQLPQMTSDNQYNRPHGALSCGFLYLAENKGNTAQLRQYRIIIFVRLRRQIFRQIVQIERRQADACQAKFVQYGGKDASKRAEKALAGNCAVLP